MIEISEVNCLVCHNICSSGFHFDAQTCAACAAFFRRSVVERQQYSCRNRTACTIELGLKYRKTCRYCRYQRCLAVGMRPEKVRNVWKEQRKSEPILPNILQISETDIGLDEIVHFYLAHKQFRQQQYNSVPNASMMLMKNITYAMQAAEQSLMMGDQDSPMLNRYFALDGSFTPATLAGLTKFYEEFPPSMNSPSFLATITMPCVDYQLNVLVAAINDLKPDITESAALLNLIFFDPDIPGLSFQAKEAVSNRRTQIVTDLHKYYQHTRTDVAVRLGNLLLLLSPIKECVRHFREMFQMFSLARAPLLEDRLQTNETS